MEKVFISYSHKDEAWKDRLVTHLGVLEKQDFLEVWDDRRIRGGHDWYEEIQEALESANVAILMISANFLTSDFILAKEVPQLLTRRGKKGLRVIPIIVKPCAWQEVKWLKRMQARPKDGKPLSSMRGHRLDGALATLAKEIIDMCKVAGEAKKGKKARPLPREHVFTAKLPTTGKEQAAEIGKEMVTSEIVPKIEAFAKLKAEWQRLKQAPDPKQRGFDFELWLRDLFVAHGFSVHGSFRRKEPDEQLDGAIHCTFKTFLVEAKWLSSPVDGAEIDRLAGRLRRSPEGTQGLFVSVSGFNDSAVMTAKGWLGTRVIYLVDESHLICLLEPEIDGRSWLEAFHNVACRMGRPYVAVDEVKNEMVGMPRVDRETAREIRRAKVFTAKLPTTGHELFGREKVLGTLDKAWDDEHTNVLSLVAWGGVGKTALVNHWLGHMELDNWRGAERVYGWSFYSQGTREDRQASGDEFLAHALKWFGDPDPKEGSPWDKGERLADLVRKEKTLLILDGLEPLQYPPGAMQGRLKDQGLGALLRGLLHGNPGLCIVTTREKVKDIDQAEGATLKRVYLENLSVEAGVELLKSLGVKGTDKELREAVEDFDRHALALNLLGTYLSTVHEGEIRKRDLVPRLTDEEEQGRHAKRVMESYEIWLKGTAELDILYLMGLFDRPAPGGAIDVLRKEPVITGLTDNLQKLSEANWKFAVKRLRDLRLLGERDESEPEKVDCHPLVREHFGAKLQEDKPKAWKEAHGRLYEYYKGLPEKEQPDTLDEMEPLFAAVSHGCLAGEHTRTWEEVYWKRIKRGNEHYSTQKLGAFGADLAAVSCFFDKPWGRPAEGLNPHRQALVLNLAGFRLRALGRLSEAADVLLATLKAYEATGDPKEIAIAAGNLSELCLTLGQVEKAVDYARRNVEYADRSADKFWRMASQTTLADGLHQAGEAGEARKLFEKAEEMQKERQPDYPHLYSLWGFRFCDLLLSEGQYKDVRKRASETLKWAQEAAIDILSASLDKLSLGRAYLVEAVGKAGGRPLRLSSGQGADFLNQAVDGLRESGNQDDIPRGLLARAELYRYQGSWDKAWADLEEAKEIAERGQMKLYLADCELEAARLRLAEGKKEKEARKHYEEAAKRVKDMGYHRRDPEVMLIQAELELIEGDKKAAREKLGEAKECIDKMACHRWDIEVERLQARLKKSTKTQ